MKKILALVVALMMLSVGLTFAVAEDDGFYIGYSNMQLAEDFFITVSNGLKTAAEANGIKFEETIANRDAVLMAQNIEAFLQKGVDMVIDFNVLAETGSEMAARCAEEGVPMISVDCEYDGAYFFGVDNYGAGAALGEGTIEFVEEKLGGQIDWIVSLWDSQSGDTIKARCDGVVDVLAEKYGVDEEHQIWIDSLADDVKTGTMTRDWLNSHPDAKNIVFVGQNDDRGYAINNTVVTEGRVDDCIIVSHNADPASIENLQAHLDGDTAWVCTASYNSHLYGEQIIDMAIQILNGEDVPDHGYTKVSVVSYKNVEEYVASLG